METVFLTKGVQDCLIVIPKEASALSHTYSTPSTPRIITSRALYSAFSDEPYSIHGTSAVSATPRHTESSALSIILSDIAHSLILADRYSVISE